MQRLGRRATRKLFEGLRKGWTIHLGLKAEEAMALYGALDMLAEGQTGLLTDDERAHLSAFLPRLSLYVAAGRSKRGFIDFFRENWTTDLSMTVGEGRALTTIVGALCTKMACATVEPATLKRLRDRLRQEIIPPSDEDDGL
jgi:hypothetical protein